TDDNPVLRNTPNTQLGSAWGRLQELFYRDGIAAQDPVAAFEYAVLFTCFGIRVRHNDELRCESAGNLFQPDVCIAHERPLKIVEPEPMSSMENERHAGKPCSPSAQDACLGAVCMHKLRFFSTKQTPELK